MPPRLNLHGASRSLALRSRTSIASHRPRIAQVAAGRRAYADEKKASTPTPTTTNGALPHGSEEAAQVAQVMGRTRPDLEQGTPVQEILKSTQEAKEKAPRAIKDDVDNSVSVELDSLEPPNTTFANLLALGQMENIASGGHGNDAVTTVGHKFGLPTLPIPSTNHLKHRYDPLVEQITNLLMRDGKKSVAQRHMSFILNHLRTSPPPVPSTTRPLLAGAPPASHLPLDPVGYLGLAIDSVAPLIRLRSQKGGAGGGVALQIPVPLGIKQRRRQAIQWILDVINKKRSRGSGKDMFAQKFADEIISVVEGKSGVWERRMLAHKTGTSARANLNLRGRR